MSLWRLLIWFSLVAFCQSAQSIEKQILFLGDSLTSGYGVKAKEDYPALLEKMLQLKGHQVTSLNAAEGGSLSSSILTRFEFHLKRHRPDLVVIATGGNDARQTTPVVQIKKNIRAAILRIRGEKIPIVLVAMQIFPNLGPEYAASFAKLYSDLARTEKVKLAPFPLAEIAGQAKYQQEDGFHPNAEGHLWMANKLLPILEPML